MKTFLLIVSAILLLGFSFRGENIKGSNLTGDSNTPKLHCPSAPSFAETVKNEQKNEAIASEDIDQGWYQKAVEKIQNEEYNITYSEELGSYQSPNRANNIRFIYHNDGFTAKTRSNKIPKFDVNDKTLSEVEKEYDTVDEWSVKLKVESGEWRMESEKLQAAGNKAWIENDKIRIDYTNTKDGMRQDFIVKQKPAGEGKLKLDLSAETKLKMIVGADALMFKNDKGEEKMKYTSLKVWDANGKPLRAYFEKKELSTLNSQFSILVNDAEAVYPVTIDPLSTTASWTAIGTQVEDLFGHTAATAGDVNGDGYSDVVIGAPEFDNSQTNGGRVYVYYGSAAGLSATANWTKDELGLTVGGRFGYSVATAGDVNGDGYSDLIVGAIVFTNSPSVYGPGKAFVYHGSSSGLSAGANWGYAYFVANSGFGYSVSSAGDVNGDGYSDVIVGAPYSGINSDPGTAFVFHGGAAGLNPNPNWQYTNIFSFAYLGTSVSTAGDVNGDGYSDVIVGGPREPNGFTNAGKAIVFHGSASGLLANPNWTVLGSHEGAELGRSVSTAGDVNGDGYSDVIVGIWNFTNGNISEGRVNVYHGSSTGLSGSANWFAESNTESAALGTFVSSAGDINGDGYGDIIAGAPYLSNGQANEGKAFAWFGSSTGLGANGSPANADWSAESDLDTNYFGSCVATAGDVNGDGYSDVLVSSNSFPYDGYNRAGKVSLFTGSQSGLSTTLAWSDESNQQDAFFGHSVSTAGDVNGDGYSDVIVGAYNYDNGQTNEGRVYVYHGSSTGLSTTANTVSESNSASALFGYSVSAAGDVNGDGLSDVLVGGPGWAGSGRVYVFHGSLTGISTVWNYSLNADGSGEYFGCSVSTAGDVNGDGYSDVIVGAENYANGQTQEGKAYIFNGGSTGLNNSTYSWSTESNQANARLGHSVSSAGDVNGDGYSDVIVGAWTYDNGQTDEGVAWVHYGSVTGISGNTFLEINSASAVFGSSVASAGDVNGDGYGDVIIGASSYSNPEFLEGAAFVFNGSSSGINTTPSWQTQSNQTLTNLGISVATAGDVNGDGYSDVIVGAMNFENGQTDEGKAQVHYGSQTGLSTTPAWTIESNTVNANFGVSVSSAGDVNGDGYSDVIAGAYRFNGGLTQEGKAFVYYGGGGSGNSRATVQQYAPGSSTVIGSGGLTYNNGQVKLAMFAKSPFGRTKAKISHEYKTNGNPFSGTVVGNGTGSTGTGTLTNLGLTGTEIFHDIAGLQTGKLYKWRARVHYDLASNPYQKYGPWKYYNVYNPLPHGNFRPSNGLTLNKILNLTMLVEGFYNPATNTTVQDTVRVYMRNSTNPYVIVDSSTAVFNSSGQAAVYFTNASNGVNYYIQVKHRNSLETWSKTTQAFASGVMNYDFTTAATKAFGDNMKQIDTSPVEFAVYSGDVNKDGSVDATDLSSIDNDATGFVSGYVVTDLTGDNFVDGTDFAIADNNAANFVSVVRP
jgi:hypothetical protein